MACLTREGIKDGKRQYTLNIERLARNKVNAYQYTPFRDEWKKEAKDIRWSWAKEKKVTDIEKHVEHKSKIPGPSQYQIDLSRVEKHLGNPIKM